MDSQDENSELGHEGKAHPRQGVAAMTTLAELRLAWQASGLHLSDEFLAGMLAYIKREERMKNLQPTVNDDRLVFSEIAQSVVSLIGLPPIPTPSQAEKLLDDIRRQCEARIREIDGALGDV
jgi:hypothetical protein